MKKGKYFNYKERGHIAYNYPKKKKIAAISESINENSNSQKKIAFSKVKEKNLLVFSSFMLEDLFCKSFLTI